jgi:hypothetical protein
MRTKASSSWFVSVELPKQKGKRRFARWSDTFQSEAEAKVFARQKLEQGFLVTAGTVNPAVPRRVIPSEEIHCWLEESAELNKAHKPT